MAKIQTWLRKVDAWTRALADQLVARPAPIDLRVEQQANRTPYLRRRLR